jgi:chemotaxis regulatin CheY-phosphate phosphatase CheZ
MSMNLSELDDILQKVAELRVLFDFGRKTVPIIDDVVSFVNEIGPAIESMKTLIRVASTKIPKASEQLGRVNQTAEQASNDILNTTDRMVSLIETMKDGGSGNGAQELLLRTAEKVSASVNTLVDKSGWDEDVQQLLNYWELHFQSLKASNASDGLGSRLEELRKDCTDVMMALQVQDITGQQIAMVIGTMQALGDVLQDLAKHFDDVAPVFPSTDELPHVPLTESVGADDRKRLVESLLIKARSGELLQH